MKDLLWANLHLCHIVLETLLEHQANVAVPAFASEICVLLLDYRFWRDRLLLFFSSSIYRRLNCLHGRHGIGFEDVIRRQKATMNG